ncbi:hypothetical protein BM221_010476 [Beauveria bassiana]|uniref:Uncharacterized protein n=1 Tax=Beauveria bassiana TaxID=176275 RepID=A0A2N6N8Y3_BEABA|nr:hypothetical protein BM221_010476 [Beauveria bassiana]
MYTTPWQTSKKSSVASSKAFGRRLRHPLTDPLEDKKALIEREPPPYHDAKTETSDRFTKSCNAQRTRFVSCAIDTIRKKVEQLAQPLLAK